MNRCIVVSAIAALIIASPAFGQYRQLIVNNKASQGNASGQTGFRGSMMKRTTQTTQFGQVKNYLLGQNTFGYGQPGGTNSGYPMQFGGYPMQFGQGYQNPYGQMPFGQNQNAGFQPGRR